MANATIKGAAESLPIIMCLLIDMPENGIDCSETHPDKCVKCRIKTSYLTGETVDDQGGVGHIFCCFLWVITSCIGICGTFGNILIVAVLRKRSGSDKGFDYLLTVLACFDVICCIMSVIATTTAVVFFDNWSGRGAVVVLMMNISWISLLFGRTASQFMTVAITIERWLVITFPFRSSFWFTSTKTKLLSVSVLTLAILLSIPRSTSRYVTVNPYNGHDGYDIPSLRNLTYYLSSTSLTKFWYRTLRSVHYQIDFWLPLPLLLLFNILSFWQVQKLSVRRKEMNVKQRKEIQAVKMFLPVVIVLLICNFGPISMFVMVHFYNVLYREVFMTTIFSIGLTSSVNYVIYHFLGSTFKLEAREVLNQWFGIQFNEEKVNKSMLTISSTNGINSKAGMEISERV